MLYRICALFYCCFFCLVVGCGSSKPYDVRAVVTLDDKPLAGAEVSLFLVRDDAKSATGITDEDGQVTFKTREAAGVLPGTYIITLTKTVEENRLSNSEIRALAEVGMRYRPKMIEFVPEKYTRRETSDLKITVGYWSSKNLTFSLRSEKSSP
jgi:hypothetical protein